MKSRLFLKQAVDGIQLRRPGLSMGTNNAHSRFIIVILLVNWHDTHSWPCNKIQVLPGHLQLSFLNFLLPQFLTCLRNDLEGMLKKRKGTACNKMFHKMEMVGPFILILIKSKCLGSEMSVTSFWTIYCSLISSKDWKRILKCVTCLCRKIQSGLCKKTNSVKNTQHILLE